VTAPSVVGLVAKLLYGNGLRIMEAVRLRVKGIDFPMKHRVLPVSLRDM
jgi:site-specific recombinase XerD